MLGDTKFAAAEMYARIKQLYKKFSLLCFCKFLCLVGLRICVCLNRTKPRLEFVSLGKSNQYSIRSFQKLLTEVIDLWIHYLTHPSKWRVEIGVWEVSIYLVLQEIVYVFSVSCLIYSRIAYIWSMYHSFLWKGFSLPLFLPSQRESHSAPDSIFWTPVLWRAL